MVIKPNLLQGGFFWILGAIVTTALLVGTLTLLPVVASLVPGKADYGEFPKLPTSNASSLFLLLSSCAVFASSYRVQKRRMNMTLSARTKAALFVSGAAFNASVAFLIYLWACSFL